MNFADAVRSTPEIAECLKNGLQALGRNSRKIKVRVTRDLKGSVDIDARRLDQNGIRGPSSVLNVDTVP